jgi:hypothetical protein
MKYNDYNETVSQKQYNMQSNQYTYCARHSKYSNTYNIEFFTFHTTLRSDPYVPHEAPPIKKQSTKGCRREHAVAVHTDTFAVKSFKIVKHGL